MKTYNSYIIRTINGCLQQINVHVNYGIFYSFDIAGRGTILLSTTSEHLLCNAKISFLLYELTNKLNLKYYRPMKNEQYWNLFQDSEQSPLSSVGEGAPI